MGIEKDTILATKSITETGGQCFQMLFHAHDQGISRKQ
jgi:hypothetical protein